MDKKTEKKPVVVMKSQAIYSMMLCAMFAALTALCSQLAVPIEPVPINLATLSIFIAGGVLGAKNGALSQVVYVLMGAVGLPVFSSFSGGIGIIAGPTGGYIIGYVAAAWMVGLLTEKFGKKYYMSVISMVAGLALCYLLGTVWFMVVTKTGLAASLMMCVVPFLIGDAAKIAVASVVVVSLRKVKDVRVSAMQHN